MTKKLLMSVMKEWLGITGSSFLRMVSNFVTAHRFCASRDTLVSYGRCLLIQGYFCAV